MTPTILWTHIFYAVLTAAGLLTALPPSMVDLVPSAWKPYVIFALSAAAWLKANRNLFINPNGTPAAEPYTPAPKPGN